MREKGKSSEKVCSDWLNRKVRPNTKRFSNYDRVRNILTRDFSSFLFIRLSRGNSKAREYFTKYSIGTVFSRISSALGLYFRFFIFIIWLITYTNTAHRLIVMAVRLLICSSSFKINVIHFNWNFKYKYIYVIL